MKYVLYKFPYDIGQAMDRDTVLLEKLPSLVKPELIAVEYGNDVYEVTNDLIHDVTEDLAEMEEYKKGYQFTATVPKEPEILPAITDKFFLYEMFGVVMPVYGKENILIAFGVTVREE